VVNTRSAALLSILGISLASLVTIKTPTPHQRLSEPQPRDTLAGTFHNEESSADATAAACYALDHAIAQGASPTVRPSGRVSGTPLTFNRESPAGGKGRVMPVTIVESTFAENDLVAFPTPDGTAMMGTINAVQTFPDGALIEGELLSGGSFSVHLSRSATFGHILLPKSFRAIELLTEPSGTVIMVERLLSSVICAPGFPQPLVAAPAAANNADANAQKAPPEPLTVPLLESLPNIPASGDIPEIVHPVVYLHFVNDPANGATYNRGYWNKGKPFAVLNTTLNASDISYIHARVAEDFKPFKINVTTDPAALDRAIKNNKNWVQAWITPTKTAAPKDGGVAVLGGFSSQQIASPTPDITRVGFRHCWAFTQERNNCADTISHEVGHTLGLGHWGTPTAEYYLGHGEGSLSWGPIMGAGSKSVTQWSKLGSYFKQVGKGNKSQDDLAIITRTQNSVSFVDDEDQNTMASASPLSVQQNQFIAEGVIHSSSDADFYSFTTSGGTVVATCTPSAVSPNLKVRLSLLTDRGVVIRTSSMNDRMEAAVTEANLEPGTYYLKVEGASHLIPEPVSGGAYTIREAAGFPKYGSIGGYRLAGNIAGSTPTLAFTSNQTVSGKVFAAFHHVFSLEGESPTVSLVGTLPKGLTFQPETQTISGVPTVASVQTLPILRDKSKRVLSAPGLNILPGMSVSGDGIPQGTTVHSVSGSNVTLSSATTAASTKTVSVNALTTIGKKAVTLSPGGTRILVGSPITGPGIPAGTTVTASTTHTVTLSKPASASSISTVNCDGYIINNSKTVTLASSDITPIVGTPISGPGIPTGTTVTKVSKNLLTLSQSPTASSTAPVNFTATTVANSKTLTAKTQNVFLSPGSKITGPGIPEGTIITAINGLSATMSADATVTSPSTGLAGFEGTSLVTAKVAINAILPVKLLATASAPTEVSFAWPDNLVATAIDRFGNMVTQDVHLNIAKGGTFYSFLGKDSQLAGKGFGMNFFGISANPWASQSDDLPENTDLTETGVSGKVSNGGYTEVSVKFTAAASSGLSFYWKTSSEATYDKLSVLIDGKEATALSGEQSWNRKSLSVAAGTRTIAFRYTKDAFVTEGADRAYVGGLEFGSVAEISKQPVSAAYLATASTNPTPLSITAVIPSDDKAKDAAYQWFSRGTGIGDGKSWVAVNGATSSELPLAKADVGVRQYRCEITNYFGTVSSEPAVITTN
jgi:hypothetical protein